MTSPRCKPHVIAVTGGIGSGKSVVSRIVAAMGYPVYDCDSRAKMLMDNDRSMKTAIADCIDRGCITADGAIDRKALAAIVFNDKEKLAALNSIVHGAVAADIRSWIDRNPVANKFFIETAILYQSGLDAMVDEVWEVKAPADVRISRVMKRNGLARHEVEARINSQDSYIPAKPHHNIIGMVNDGVTPLLPQIERQLASDNWWLIFARRRQNL